MGFPAKTKAHRQFTLSMNMPRHAAKRNTLAGGEAGGLSLFAEGQRWMPLPSRRHLLRWGGKTA